MFILHNTHLTHYQAVWINEQLMHLFDRYFEHRQTYSKQHKDHVLARCRQQLDMNELYVVLERPSHLSLWRQLPKGFKPPEGVPQPVAPAPTPVMEPIVQTFLDQYRQGQRLFHNIALEKQDLSRTYLSGVELNYGLLNETLFQGANLTQASLAWAYLREANLQGANLMEANLEGAFLNWANLASSDLSCCQLLQAELKEAHLEGARLWRANMQGAELQNADLSHSDLRRADLTRANLVGANLTGADLREARVGERTLKKAHLQDTILPNHPNY